MPTVDISIKESEIIKLINEFLQNRDLSLSMMSLERETGVINGLYSDDMVFLRQLIFEGQWDDVLDFVQPLTAVDIFDYKKFRYYIYKHKFLELVCLKADPGPQQDFESIVEEVVATLNELKILCQLNEYNNLCQLLTEAKLSNHPEFSNWNPSIARLQCFKHVYPLLEPLLPCDNKKDVDIHVSRSDRLINLLLKGLLYEACMDHCQQKACGTATQNSDTKLINLIANTVFCSADLSLLSWLSNVPNNVFSHPFELQSLTLNLQPLLKPSLEASWSEHILMTPIKPKQFPFSAVPQKSSKKSDILTRSLNPQFDGLSSGLWKTGRNNILTSSLDHSLLTRSMLPRASVMRQTIDVMHKSVEKLFSNNSILSTSSIINPSSLNDTSRMGLDKPISNTIFEENLKDSTSSSLADFPNSETSAESIPNKQQKNLSPEVHPRIEESPVNSIQVTSTNDQDLLKFSSKIAPDSIESYQDVKRESQAPVVESTEKNGTSTIATAYENYPCKNAEPVSDKAEAVYKVDSFEINNESPERRTQIHKLETDVSKSFPPKPQISPLTPKIAKSADVSSVLSMSRIFDDTIDSNIVADPELLANITDISLTTLEFNTGVQKHDLYSDFLKQRHELEQKLQKQEEERLKTQKELQEYLTQQQRLLNASEQSVTSNLLTDIPDSTPVRPSLNRSIPGLLDLFL